MFNISSIFFIYLILACKINTQNISSNKKNTTIYEIESKYIASYKYENNDYSKNINNQNSKTILTQKKNLIVGVAKNYRWKTVQPFFKSFEAVGFKNCDCIMFVARLKKKTINKIESCGVIVKNMPEEYINMKTNKIRWKLYLDYINENSDKYDLILATDTRDVIFQQDLFQFYDSKKPFLGVAIEKDFLNETINRRWFIYAFGKDIYETVKNEKIINGGTFIGTTNKFLLLANKVWEKVKYQTFSRKLHDQSIVNYIVCVEKIFDDCLKKSENKDGNIITIGLIKKNVSLDSEDNILNEKGEIASLVHQYERVRLLKEKVRKKFCVEGKVNISQNIYKKEKSFIIFSLVLILIIIIVVISRFKYNTNKNLRKYKYKKYKSRKNTKKYKKYYF